MDIRNRVVELRRVRANTLTPHPQNWRTHNDAQRQALNAVLQKIGFAGAILAVERDNGLLVCDGHLRSEEMGEQEVPVLVLDLNDTEVATLLTTFDPISQMAGANKEKLDALLATYDLGKTNGETAAISADLQTRLDGMLAKLAKGAGSEWGKVRAATEDEVPEVPAIPVTEPGDLWVLGNHRLLCGDCTKAEHVAEVLAGGTPFMMVTDPPYGVNYDPTFRSNNRTGVVTNDDRASWQATYRLFGGQVAYVWHGGLHVVTVAEDLLACDFELRAMIIWMKPALVMGRGHYHWQHEGCQPAGTLVEKVVESRRGSLRAITEQVPIESLRDCDRVVSWNGVVVKQRGTAVEVANRKYDGDLHTVQAGGCSTRTTHCHHWSVRISKKPMWLTYLMRRGNRWRVGQVQSFNTRGFGPSIRLKDEAGDAVWVLGTHETLREAMVYEQAISVRYGIPTTHWTPADNHASRPDKVRQQADIDKLYDLVGPLDAKAAALLEDYGRHIELPLATNDGIRGGRQFFSRNKPTEVRSCNLIPLLMELPQPTGSPRDCEPHSAGREGWRWVTIEAVSRQAFSGMVYSLDVGSDKHYVADGLITHNCFYAAKGTAKWCGDRTQSTNWQIDHVHPTLGTTDDGQTRHGCQKPVECMARPIRNHGGPEDDVYDPFVGSGTTIIACEQLGRRCRALEVDPGYVDVATTRWQNLVGGDAIMESTGETFAQVKARREQERAQVVTAEALPTA